MGRSSADFALVAGAVGRGRPLKTAVSVALGGASGKGVRLDVSVRGCLCHGALIFLSHTKLTSVAQRSQMGSSYLPPQYFSLGWLKGLLPWNDPFLR